MLCVCGSKQLIYNPLDACGVWKPAGHRLLRARTLRQAPVKHSFNRASLPTLFPRSTALHQPDWHPLAAAVSCLTGSSTTPLVRRLMPGLQGAIRHIMYLATRQMKKATDTTERCTTSNTTTRLRPGFSYLTDTTQDAPNLTASKATKPTALRSQPSPCACLLTEGTDCSSPSPP